MNERGRKKNIVVRKPKVTVRKQLAKTTPPMTSPPTATTSLIPSSNPPLPLRTHPEPQLDQPPRYSLLFPLDQISLPQRPRQSLHSPLHLNPTYSSPPPPPATSNAFHPASSSLLLARPVSYSGHPVDDIFIEQQRPSPEAIAREALCDLISTKFDAVITSIDSEQFGGEEQELLIQDDVQSGIRGGWGLGGRQVSRGANRAISTAVVGTNYFAKANLYANSRLPPNLPPLQL